MLWELTRVVAWSFCVQLHLQGSRFVVRVSRRLHTAFAEVGRPWEGNGKDDVEMKRFRDQMISTQIEVWLGDGCVVSLPNKFGGSLSPVQWVSWL